MKKSFGFAKTAALMGVIILAAKLMGLVRDVMVAGAFGTSVYAVAYETASRLPVTIFDFVLGGVVTSAFIPVYNSIAVKEGKAKASSFAQSYTNLILLLTAVIAVLGVIFALALVSFIAPDLAADTAQLAVRLTRIMFPMVIFVGLAFTFVGFLQSEGEYNIPAVISLVSNLIMVGWLALSGASGTAPLTAVTGLSCAMLIGTGGGTDPRRTETRLPVPSDGTCPHAGNKTCGEKRTAHPRGDMDNAALHAHQHPSRFGHRRCDQYARLREPAVYHHRRAVLVRCNESAVPVFRACGRGGRHR